ncbi:MAG: extracellular solute-binding protein [Rhodospirillales bacterium]|nr:extracellular solute-binding protein [Rhodospirillales bacterium]
MFKQFHMTISASVLALGVLALGFGPAITATANAADLPKATAKTLKKLKFDVSMLKGLDAELKVPNAWIEGAKKEKEVVILGTWSNRAFKKMTKSFNARYPFIKLRYHRTKTSGRGMKVLIALHGGRVITDVTTSIADSYFEFTKMKALADLRELPGYKNVAKAHRAKDGTWAAFKISFRCMGYNTDKVKKSELPKTWDELLTNPRWRNGNISFSNHPNAWLLNLWGIKGEKWGQKFTKGLYDVVKPQKRKEGMTAMTALTVAGAAHANIPAPAYRVKKYQLKGAPIAYHCPAPVPITLSQIVMLEKAKHKNAARLFINWILSKEGQIMQYATSLTVPVHQGLPEKQFLAFPDTILGKQRAVRDDAMLNSQMHKDMLSLWNANWIGVPERKRKKRRKGKKRKKN